MEKGLRTGLGFNIPAIKKLNPEIFEKHKLMLAMFDEDVETIYMNELVAIVGYESANEFMRDVMPEVVAVTEGRMTLDEYVEEMMKKNIKIRATEI